MTLTKTLTLLVVIALLAVAPGSAPPDSICKATAKEIRKAAKSGAHADFWVQTANCLNETDECTDDCIDDADDELDDALDLAEDQYDARLCACALLGGGAYDPDLDPDDFSANVTNPFFKLVVNRTLVYRKPTDEGIEEVRVKTLPGTVLIDGLPCRAVSDKVFLAGVLIEDTIDWFTQHDNGTVWYAGEIAKNFEDGFLADIDGSWMSGKDGAKAGIQMRSSPTPGAVYRQEFLVNEAEDIARVVALGQTVHVPAGTFTGCVKTEEWSPLSPGNTEFKYFAPGIGLVLEVDPESGERLELVQILNN